MDDKERIRLLEEEIKRLKKEKLVVVDALTEASSLSNFQVSLNQLEDPERILRQTAERVRRVLDFKALSFYLVDEVNSDFFQAYTDPPSTAGSIDRELNALIDDKTFTWVLHRNKPVQVSSIDGRDKIILHSMNTSSRNRGMFIGILSTPQQEILDLSLFLFSVTITACSNGLESFELYRQIKQKNLELEQHIYQLEATGTELQEKEEKYRALFEQSTNSIILYDIEHRTHVEFNDLACDSLGYTREEFRELKIEDYAVVEPSAEATDARIRRLVDSGQGSFETIHIQRDGTFRNVIIHARPITISEKTYLLTLVHDITERKKMEAERVRLEGQLRQAQKMEAIGTLAGGIAHDFNNILGVIVGYCELSQMELPEDDASPFNENLESMLKAAGRAKELVRQILTFSRRGEEKRVPIDINLIAKETLQLMRSTLPSTIQLRHNVDGASNFILGAAGQVQQILMNLCNNAIHAMQGTQGRLLLDLQRIDGSTHSDTEVPLKPVPYIQISVSDSGHGIGRGIIDRVFDPYFTTKEPDEGTGLGLSVVHGIVKSYEGQISIDSRPDEGTTVLIWIPALDNADIKIEEKPQTLPTGSERILLVEDEEALLVVHRKLLEQLKYTVTAVNNGITALETFMETPSAFDLVITDMGMPGMTGLELTREILNHLPEMPVILCTGFSEFMDPNKARSMGFSDYLMKPIDKYTLAATVRGVLDRHAAGPAS